MKMRKLSILLILVLLLAALPISAMAARGDSQAQLGYVTDTYGLLSPEEVSSLESQAAQLSQRYGFSLYVVVLRDYTDYGSSTFQVAMDIFGSYTLGWGSERDGAMLLLSMADRDYELLFHGDRADTAFTEYGRDLMEDRILSFLRQNDYAGGFREYLYCAGEYLQAAEDGKPVDREKHLSVLMLIPGAIAAAVTGLIGSSSMRSAGTKTDADAYIAPGTVNLQVQTDLFLHRSVTRVPRQTESRSSGGGGSHSSGSFSGRSGKF